jgi:hypothetical protein
LPSGGWQRRLINDEENVFQLALVQRRATQHKAEYERELKDCAQLLDSRAMRIQKLESQLHALAYGKRRKIATDVRRTKVRK